jgi:hypothetical protein
MGLLCFGVLVVKMRIREQDSTLLEVVGIRGCYTNFLAVWDEVKHRGSDLVTRCLALSACGWRVRLLRA